LPGEPYFAKAEEYEWDGSSMAGTKRERVLAMWADLIGLLAVAGLALAF